MTLVKIEVCASCNSPYIIIADCICTYQKDYETIELEFEKCECCDNVQSMPAKTEFNKSKIDFK